jgi:acetyl esterase/lipase
MRIGADYPEVARAIIMLHPVLKGRTGGAAAAPNPNAPKLFFYLKKIVMNRPILFENKLLCFTILFAAVLAKATICKAGLPIKGFSHSTVQVTAVTNTRQMPDTTGRFVLISSSHTGVAADYKKPLQITFNQPVDESTLKNIVITEGGAEGEPIGAESKVLSGKWLPENDPKTIVFKPSKKLEPGIFISVTFPESFKSLRGTAFTGGKDLISFIMDNDVKNGQRIVKIDTLKIVDGNRISLVISVPENSEKHPVMIFVHGGGWTGGTASLSSGSLPSGHTPSYICDKLGVAVVGVGYRCIGANGNFAKAKADIEDAIKYVKAHAKEYNLDLNRILLCGESAGAPLSALIAQKDKDIKYYIGWNGIYDFVNDSDGKFGQGNNYGQEEPSAEANSALYHIRQTPPITLLIHGTSDATINNRQSVAFTQGIKDAGGYAKLLLFAGQPHWYYYAPGGKYEISTLYQIKDFLIKQMALKVK